MFQVPTQVVPISSKDDNCRPFVVPLCIGIKLEQAAGNMGMLRHRGLCSRSVHRSAPSVLRSCSITIATMDALSLCILPIDRVFAFLEVGQKWNLINGAMPNKGLSCQAITIVI